ncbi:dihydrodipicolinate synthase family protein [Paludibaculum fermentans]|uniref:dihydrodipicolinate synthase family protein n=1 Tax=Paludibaculum fermentans TaxID=1473598 RepID=UPI003EBE2B42
MARYPQAILISCEIPWDEQENLLEEVFRQEIRHVLASGFTHLYTFGTAGEGYAVDTSRFRQVAELFRAETSVEGVRAQVGVIALSTAQVRERLHIAYNLGFRDFQISLPFWGALNDTELLRFFVDVCSSFPDCNFLHYNLMRSKRVLTGSDYRRIADAVPNLVATKNMGTNVLTTMDLLRNAPDLQHFLGESMFPTGCLHGECSFLAPFGPLIPQRTRELFDLGRTHQWDRLFTFQSEYLRAVEEVIAPMRRQNLIDGAYDKAIVRLAGIAMPLRLLSPYETFSEEVFEECQAILREKYADWAK